MENVSRLCPVLSKSEIHSQNVVKIPLLILISNFRIVLTVVCFLLGDSPASEIYMPTFRNTLFHLHRQVGACRMNSAEGMLGYYSGKGLAWKWSEQLGRVRQSRGAGQSTETSCEGSPA